MNETTPARALTESGNKCLISSSSNWIIDSGATDHMAGNPKIISEFRSHKVPSSVTIADGSSYTIEDLESLTPLHLLLCPLFLDYLVLPLI